MNKSPDPGAGRSRRKSPADDRLFLDLAAESRIQSGEPLSNHPELAADRALKDELAGLESPTVPDALRARVLVHGRPRRRSASWLALAAVVVLSVMLVIAVNREPAAPADDHQRITASDWMELQLALNTLDASGRQMAQLADKEIRPLFARPDGPLTIKLPRMPTLESLLRRFDPSMQPAR